MEVANRGASHPTRPRPEGYGVRLLVRPPRQGLPDEGIGVVVLMNTPAGLRCTLTYWLIDRALGVDGAEWSPYMLQETEAARTERERVASARVESVPSGPSLVPTESVRDRRESVQAGCR
jgi:hypothetical protein